MELDAKREEMVVSYEPNTERAFFDVCDIYGNVLHTQKFTATFPARWSYHALTSGRYNLFVVDGENMMRYQFTI